ncbi:MAG TPA: hypothetical protein PKA53_02450, partial [Sphingobacterium sp.]|nr:hypothetical protein [Sphingobacterium sp.]
MNIRKQDFLHSHKAKQTTAQLLTMNSLLLFYMRLLLIIATLSFGFSTFAQTVNPTSGIVYVKPMATGDGSSWNNATTDLQAAIDAPGVQKVFVAVGTYNAPSPNGFKMKNGVEIYGGFGGIAITDLTHNRILPNQLSSSGGDGGEGSVLNGQNAGKVINNNYTSDNRLNSSAVLDGFIIMNGKSGDNGGGIYNSYASSVFNNVVVKNNAAVNNGGGVYNYNSNAEFTNSIIRNNSLSGGAGNGGGVCNWESSPKFTNVSITDNTVGSNTLNAYGGGVSNLGSTSKPIFTNVTIARNAINSPYSYGAAMYNNGSSPEMYNSIIWANVNNSSVIIGDADIYNNGEATLVLKNSITQVYSSGENLKVNQNPQFVNAAAGNYTLQAISPAINGGDNTLYAGLNANTQDLAGHVRVHN